MLTTHTRPNYQTSAKPRITTSIAVFETLIRNAKHVWMHKQPFRGSSGAALIKICRAIHTESDVFSVDALKLHSDIRGYSISSCATCVCTLEEVKRPSSHQPRGGEGFVCLHKLPTVSLVSAAAHTNECFTTLEVLEDQSEKQRCVLKRRELMTGQTKACIQI